MVGETPEIKSYFGLFRHRFRYDPGSESYLEKGLRSEELHMPFQLIVMIHKGDSLPGRELS